MLHDFKIKSNLINYFENNSRNLPLKKFNTRHPHIVTINKNVAYFFHYSNSKNCLGAAIWQIYLVSVFYIYIYTYSINRIKLTIVESPDSHSTHTHTYWHVRIRSEFVSRLETQRNLTDQSTFINYMYRIVHTMNIYVSSCWAREMRELA